METPIELILISITGEPSNVLQFEAIILHKEGCIMEPQTDQELFARGSLEIPLTFSIQMASMNTKSAGNESKEGTDFLGEEKQLRLQQETKLA